MPEIQLTDTFRAAFRDLPPAVQKKVLKAIRLLAENPAHPSLRSKTIRSAPGIYEASPDMHYRMTYERLTGDVLLLRVVGPHDEALKKP
jgi:mRNA-degrading endonuclease RelE of RelBE toxin-antitoxin system